jgi:uncharacterized membrane protein
VSFPAKIPGLKGITAVYTLYLFFWITQEGSLVGVVVMGIGTTAVSLAYLAQHFLGGRVFSRKQWWGITAVCGLLFGLGSGLLTLLFMAVKTGLHAHGPEFTPPEVTWLLQQIPLWTAVGLLTGLGLGLVTSREIGD